MGNRKASSRSTKDRFERHTIAAAYLGVLAGIGGVVLGGLSLLAQRSVNLEGTASVSPADFTAQGYGIRLSLNNDGLGGVTVKDPVLVSGHGQDFSAAIGFVEDPHLLASGLPYRADLGAHLQPPTFSLEGRSATTVGLVFPSTRCREPVDVHGLGPRERARNAFACAVRDCETDEDCKPKEDVSVRLKVSPGDNRDIEAKFVGGRPNIPGWEPRVRGSNGRVAALEIQRSGPGAQLATSIGRLQVWPERGDTRVKAITRPVIGGTVSFPLHDLPRGTHLWAFQAEGRLLLSGRIRNPCVLTCSIGALSAIRGKVAAVEWEGGLPPPPPRAPPPDLVLPPAPNGRAP